MEIDLDGRLLRLLLLDDLPRHSVLTSCLAAAQLCQLVLLGGLEDADGRARVATVTDHESSDHLHRLAEHLAERPNLDWHTWFLRGGLNCDLIYREMVARMVSGGVLQWPRAQWPRSQREPVDVTPMQASDDFDHLMAVVDGTRSVSSKDAVVLHLIAIAQARSYIPLDPPLPADYIDSAHDLGETKNHSLHAILDGLTEVRYRSMTISSVELGGAG